MRNIWRIIKADARSLFTHFFALAVALVIAVLPSLYAWLNIYSNWDPYGNTGGISIAVASLDEGYTDADGTYENKGDDVVADLREATSINWVIVDTEEEAKGGVESGDYYAAVVIDGIMEQSNLLAADLTADDPEAAVKGVLYQAQDLLHACGRMMDAFETAGGSGVSESSAAALEAAVANINKNLPDGAQLQQTAAEIQMRLNTALARVERALDRLSSAIGNAPELPSAQQQLRDAAAQLEKAADTLETWAAGLEASGTEAGKTQAEAARQTAAECRKTAKQLRALAESPDSADLLADCDALVKSIRTMVDRIPVTSKALQKELDTVAGQVADTMEGMAALAGDAKAMKTALAETADAVGDTMTLLRPATEKLLTSLESTIDDLEGLTTDEYMDTLVNILGGDPAVYGQYFPEMVQTSVNAVYPIANYGSAMTPFYTVLAIWVGGVILSSLIKIHARTEGLIDPKPAELYFGRYLFFFVLSQIQAAVIVTGDLYILKVQCLHPGMLYLTGALTAFTFSLLIYSLALSFGDVGKAIVVVIMVMQIAGSSGTFPIELLPAIYQKIYRFFPFPYAIDAMRECICGMYGNYYWQQIGFLLLFAAAALLIGLLVRRPFMGLNHFMEEKLEETELL